MRKLLLPAFMLLLVSGFIYGQSPAQTLEKSRDRADDAMDKMEGRVPMRFFNALNRNPIPGAAITIPNSGTYTTDSRGKIAFPKIPDGYYTLTFTKEGFITTEIAFRVLMGAVDLNNWYSISPVLPLNGLRIVLEWGERPYDLDLHFVKTGGSGNYHISFVNMRTAEDGTVILDRDDMSSYGPETITVERTDTNAAYTCYVHDYSNGSNTSSAQMAQRGATVRVYSLNRLLHTFQIPANGVGTRWDVFKIERGAVIPVNTVSPR